MGISSIFTVNVNNVKIEKKVKKAIDKINKIGYDNNIGNDY